MRVGQRVWEGTSMKSARHFQCKLQYILPYNYIQGVYAKYMSHMPNKCDVYGLLYMAAHIGFFLEWIVSHHILNHPLRGVRVCVNTVYGNTVKPQL